NERVPVQMVKKPHRIVRLEDTDGDGKYDKSTVYVANVMFPEGAMWLDGSLYVAAPPHIWKFTDTNDDGKADKEEIWYDGKTLTGCANDLHGPYLGPDGWIYWCKGAFAKQEHTVHGKPFTTRASHIFRARPDGSGIEPILTGGMDNPVDVAFLPNGERFLSCTFFQHPGNGKRDGLIHAVYGGVYGKDHAPVYEHPWTSPRLMEPMTHLGPAAPCGLHRYESDQFGKDYENNLFCCQFNMRKVSRHILVPSGSTYTTKDSDFVVSDQHDFHPTDVIEDADGSLLIMDTGGWYKLCCPSSQLVKPDVKGAVYRVKKIGAHKFDDPRGEKIDWAKQSVADLIKLLGDRRPVVWWRAIDALGKAGDKAVKQILPIGANYQLPSRLRLGAVWALCRIKGPGSMVANAAFFEGDESVRQAALHMASLHADEHDSRFLRIIVADEPDSKGGPISQRLAAEALGRIGDSKAIPAILNALADDKNDRTLDHALTYALIEIGNPSETTKGLSHKSPRVRRAVLTALDQMPGGKLEASAVLAELDSKDAALRETAWWIAGKHPQWGQKLAGYFVEQLKRADKMTPESRDALTDHLAKFANSEAVQKMLGTSLLTAPPASRPVILRAMARSGLKKLPESWEKGIAKSLVSDDEGVRRDALAAIQRVQSAKDFSKLVLEMKNWPPPKGQGGWTFGFHLQVQATAPPGSIPFDPGVLTWLDRNEGAEVRAAATEVIARSNITADGLRALASALKTAQPLDLPKILPIFAKSKDEQVGLAFVAALSSPKILPSIRTETIKPILDKYPKPVRDAADGLYAKIAEARKDDIAKLERLVKELPKGDIRRGQAVFNGAKAQCVACHKIGYVGGLVGPDLTRVGGIRTERDLLESIVFPSASFVRSYEPVRVVTADGRTLSGLLKKDAPDEIVLTIAADKEERIPRADVESISPSSVSVMPDGFDKQVTPQELADLVAFLKACR
ncbi:MAG TPA: PVC-type heme-binding CxxCH protein, partial [Gemmataceae bacterium]